MLGRSHSRGGLWRFLVAPSSDVDADRCGNPAQPARYTPDINPVLRWADFDFEIPASLTAGRDSLEIALDARASPNPWTAFGYTAFSYVER